MLELFALLYLYVDELDSKYSFKDNKTNYGISVKSLEHIKTNET